MLRSTWVSLKQTATIVTTGGALAAWLAGAVTTNHVAAPAAVVERVPVEAKSAELATEIGKLHEHLRPTASPRQPARDLFRFHAAPVAHAPIAAPVPAPAVEPPAAAPTLVPMRLIGIAEDPGPDGPIRIAFISASGQLFNAKEGDPVLTQYRVSRIAADVVELTDVNDNSVRRLALR